MKDIPLSCTCGNVQGVATVSPSSGNRVVCYCDDCQKFAHYLNGENTVLDEYGGSDIFQTAHSQIKITSGIGDVRAVRLTEKGMYRWYANCCKTPIGNTMGPGMPFVGVIHNFIGDKENYDKNLGPIRAYVHAKLAKKVPPTDKKKSGFPLSFLRILIKIFTWKIKGKNQPSPFFNPEGNPISQPEILKSEG